MSGLLKQKKYDWKDSNLAFFGSDTEKNVKKESAETEKAWQSSGEKPGLKIWRIVKFKVTDWPKEDYGKFYNGDSYIILNTYKDPKNPDSEELLYDVHFWIGKYSTQDEYGTAAYKTVELDTYLDDKPVQHREVGGHESSLFKSYFKRFELLKGGADSGFNRVPPGESYKPRLMKVATHKGAVQVTEVAFKRCNLNSSDVFIVDYGDIIHQINGSESSGRERYKASAYLQTLKTERNGRPISYTYDEGDADDVVDSIPNGFKKQKQEVPENFEMKLYRLKEKDGVRLTFDDVTDTLRNKRLDSDDVFIGDSGEHCIVWTGKKASVDERRNAVSIAHQYLRKTEHPFEPITMILEGRETREFHDFINALGVKLPA